MKPAARRLSLGIAAALAAGAIAWMLRPSAATVETGVVARRTMRETVDEEGETRVRDRFTIAAPVAGRLARIALKEGDSVRGGDIVAHLSLGPLDARQRVAAQAALDAAQDAAAEARARTRDATAQRAQAQHEAERDRQLAAAGQISPRDLEIAETALRSREADLQAAESRRRQADHAVEEARAALLGSDDGTIRSTEVRAPTGGRVLRIFEPSERVVSSGTPLLEIGDPRSIEIVVDYLSTEAVRVRRGMPALIEGWGGEGALEARVRLVEPSGFTKVSALGVEEQRVNVILDLVAPEPRLGDRYRVQVRVVDWKGDSVLAVPAGALFREGSKWRVYVVSGGRARGRDVMVGHRDDTGAEVLAGLAAGETVVMHPGDKVKEGVRVRRAG